MKKPILFAILFVMVLASVAAILQSGWTSTTNPGVARTALGVPGLTNNNVFTGSNTISGRFTGNLSGATNYNSSNLVGTVWGGISNPATGGTNVLITNAKTTIQNGGADTLVVMNGSVGIGTTGPANKLDVVGGLLSASYPVNEGLWDTASFATNVGGGLGFYGKYNTAGDYSGFASIQGMKENATDGNYAGALRLTTRAMGGGSFAEQVRITSTGNVGIGTTTPTSGRLVVDGGGITFGTDDTYGIGAVGANRPAFIKVGTGFSAFAGGLGSSRSNRLAAATITVTASPFNWTNTANVNAVVYIDGISVTGTVGVNGATVFNSIGQNTVMLQTNEWTTITYTLGTPTATWKPF